MPGAGKQSPEVQAQIKELLEAGFDPTTIHRRLKVGRSSIYRMKRCLEQHGTAYMPTELNKKNGRPKVLSAEQELEVRDWLRDPKNRTRYLDDLVWLTHDKFGIVCSTTTMSKLKRKWIKVIETEESGGPLDDETRAQVLETHPDLNILRGSSVAAKTTAATPPTQPQPQPQSKAKPQTQLKGSRQRRKPPPPKPMVQPSPEQVRQIQAEFSESVRHIPTHSPLPTPHTEPPLDHRALQQAQVQMVEQHYLGYSLPRSETQLHTPYYAVAYPPVQPPNPHFQQELAGHAMRRM